MGLTKVRKRGFGGLPDGSAVELYTLSAGSVEASVTTYGARLTSLRLPGRLGEVDEVVLGHDSVDGYVADTKTYMGAVVGRVGNRIAGGRFSLDGATYQVPPNDASNALHGGTEGFDRKLWTAEESDGAVAFTLVSADGEMGFPGALTATVRYSLTEGALRLDYTATVDRTTVVNLTNHAYFNLAGEQSGTILEHELDIPAERFTPVDAEMIPTGTLQEVRGTPFDFTRATRIGERIGADDEQLERARGYDHNWAYGNKGEMKRAARLKDRVSGRVLTVETTEPGVQFYSGNFLNGMVPRRSGEGFVGFREGLCLETQGYPDAVNHPNFPSMVLRAGETMRSATVFGFSVEE